MDCELVRLFARLFEYPSPGLREVARDCEDRAEAGAIPHEGLSAFRDYVERVPLEEQEELYTSAFDLRPETSPYIGYHLFGDGYLRSAFLQELKTRYRGVGLEVGTELPDHISLMLRFTAACADESERAVLIDEALLPALAKMTAADEANCYRLLLQSLRLVLGGG